jgi:hypothetical protein
MAYTTTVTDEEDGENRKAVAVPLVEFQARGFYERVGYACFGELPDYPKGKLLTKPAA